MIATSRYLLVLFSLALAFPIMAEIKVESAWARLLPPNVKTTAGYLTLASSEQDRLLSASSAAAKRVEIHQTTMSEGMMMMSEVQGIDLQAGQPLKLEPGGFHLMLRELNEPLKEGMLLPLVLVFEKVGAVQTSLRVEAR